MEPLDLKECCENRTPISISAKCSDLCTIRYPDGDQRHGYVPGGLNIGGGDYVEFEFCANCGMIQDKFPVVIQKDPE